MNWILCLVVGFLIYAITYAPPFPKGWAQVVRVIGGMFIVIGIILLVLFVFGVDIPTRR